MKQLTIFACALLAASTVLLAPAYATTRSPIGPHQLFIGEVNGMHSQATIQMACFGAIRPGQTGHPMVGQTVGVARTLDIPGGNTGSSGTSIHLTFGPTTTATSAIIFGRYTTKALPTTLVLPCAGQGQALFRPRPGSATARSDTVTVNFVSQP